MLLAGIDIESGDKFDVPPKDQFITELGMVLWCTELQQPVAFYNQLFLHPTKVVAEEAADYTGITQDMLLKYGVAPSPIEAAKIQMFLNKADYYVAHNGLNFDKPLIEEFMSIQGRPLPSKYWIDTTIDVPYPKHCRQTNLTYLAGYHKILNPFAHRAVTDVLTMLTILDLYDINAVVASAKEPLVVVKAEVSFHDKDKAKEMKFGWEKSGEIYYPKSWIKVMKRNHFERVRESWPFMTTVLETVNNNFTLHPQLNHDSSI